MEAVLFLTTSLYLLFSNQNSKSSSHFEMSFKRMNNPFEKHTFDTSLIMELVLSSIGRGISIPRSLEVIGASMENKTGKELQIISRKLKLGNTWSFSWKGCSKSLTYIESSLEDAWINGSSPESLIRLKIEQIRKDKLYRAKTAGEKLGVKIVIPLGLCFLPSFIFIGILPVILSMVNNLL
ncbi:MAG: type II secretion system F family protein [Bifidobacteriaceae bacterium]|jgi:tight adherence protein B|nr:type II secretion system F family protein [Bifidobacteriaceae bacterium]